MDEKALVYIIFLVIFVLSRLFRQKKKEQEQPPHVPPPPQQYQPPHRQSPPPESKKEKSLLETIMEEVERQKELTKPRPQEIKQRTHKPEKPKPKVARTYAPLLQGELERSEPIDHLEKEEGISSISERLKRTVNLVEEPEPERKFEFDPREAFMMKTLLERPYS